MAEVLQISSKDLLLLAPEKAKRPVKTHPTKREFIKNLKAAIAKRERQRTKIEAEARKRKLMEEREFSGYLNDLSRDRVDVRRWFSCHDFNEV